LAWLAKALRELSVALTTMAILLMPLWPSMQGFVPDEDTRKNRHGLIAELELLCLSR
jgi:hypothetical protein